MLQKGVKYYFRQILVLVLIALMAVPQSVWALKEQEKSGEISQENDQIAETVEPTQEPTATPEPTKEPEPSKEPEQVTQIPEPTVTATPETDVTEQAIEETEEAPVRSLRAVIKATWKSERDGRWRYLYSNGKYAKSAWEHIDGQWYYFDSKGYMCTGWYKINGYWYYFRSNGSLITGWVTYQSQLYYLKKTGGEGVLGRMLTGWRNIGSYTYYFSSSGVAAQGFSKIGNQIYYFKKTGKTGVKARMLTSWQTINGKTYYFKPSGDKGTKGRLLKGWQTIGSQTYYFKKSGNLKSIGKMLTGWQKLNKKWFYFKKQGSHGTKGRMLKGFQTINGLTYYLKKSGNLGVKGKMLTGWHTLSKKKYYFYSDGHMAKNTTIDGIALGSDGTPIGKKTIKSLLKSAISPIGSTLYIWGGGHDDGGTSNDARRIGLNPNWKKFYNSQTSNYDYHNYRYKYGKGLDCSGFVGWAVYNGLNTKSNQTSCTTTSTIMPKWYKEKGWGSYSFTTSASFKAGDVVSMTGHVWIVIGTCSDGSVVIVHCTPQAGVQLAGTVTKSGKDNSQAIKLAKAYMKKYYGKFTSKFSLSSTVPLQYLKGTNLKGINRFRWDVSGKKVMTDPNGYANMTADKILKDLFG